MANNRVLFRAPGSYDLWVTNGTTAGTYQLKALGGSGIAGNATNFTQFGQNVLFSATDPTHRTELWITNGTTAGTSLVKDINPTAYGSGSPKNFAVLGGKALFAADDGTHGGELWVTDGTTAGTSMLVDIYPGGAFAFSRPANLFTLGSQVLFSAKSVSIGYELWVSDGTAAGTSLLKDIDTRNFASSAPQQFVPLAGKALFMANDANGNGLWMTDGTGAGTTLVTDTLGGSITNLTPFGTKALFTLTTGFNADLWITDGTAAGTSLVKHTSSQLAGPSQLTALGTKMLFLSADTSGTTTQQVWVTDGTSAGTYILDRANISGSLGNFTNIGSKVLFRGNDGTHGNELWVTDGTLAGTSMVTDLNAGSGSANPNGFATLGNKAIFSAFTPSHGYEPWISDGTAAGTTLLKEIDARNANTASSNPEGFSAVTVPCFAPEVGLRTPAGYVAVRDLRPGDELVLAAGGTRPIRWIGTRRVVIERHPKPEDVAPIVVAAHAFAPGSPRVPLRLSPDHAIHVGGVLIPVRYLVNGTTVARRPAREVTWYHVELADADGAAVHDVILAENLACESYLDTGNRGAFANAEGPVTLHADFARGVWAVAGCAPLALDGPLVVAARALLARRAAALGHALSPEARLEVLVDGIAADVSLDGAHWQVRLPPGARTLRLRSRTWVPAESGVGEADTRRLGVAIAAPMGDGRALDAARFASGWHAAEVDWRWTDGEGTLDVAGLARVDFALAMEGRYWVRRAA